MKNELTVLLSTAETELEKLGLKTGTLHSYYYRAFKPIKEIYMEQYEDCFIAENLSSLKNVFWEQCKNDIISRRTLNWRYRGIEILLEIYRTGTFKWKTYHRTEMIPIKKQFAETVSLFADTLSCGNKRKQIYVSIILRFLASCEESNISDIAQITSDHLRNFIEDISLDRPKSMDDVMTALRKFYEFLNNNQYIRDTVWMLLAAPRIRSHKVIPCLQHTEIIQLIRSIDSSTICGKRDFAILSLTVETGLRAGDLALLKLADIDWKKQELHFYQGKTDSLLNLPLSKNVLNATADYILHARPATDDTHLFIRALAPYSGFKDGVSIACVFRKYLHKSAISHVIGDGKTMHGIRRSIGTAMVSQNVPVTTVSQVLGHTGIRATKQYISLDLNGLQKCALSMNSIGGADDE